MALSDAEINAALDRAYDASHPARPVPQVVSDARERLAQRTAPERHLQVCLDWLANLEAVVGREVLMNCAPNNIPSRLEMRRAIGLDYGNVPDARTPEHKAFVKEQRRLLREL